MLVGPTAAQRCIESFNGRILFMPSTYSREKGTFPEVGQSPWEVTSLSLLTYYLLCIATLTTLSTLLGQTVVLEARALSSNETNERGEIKNAGAQPNNNNNQPPSAAASASLSLSSSALSLSSSSAPAVTPPGGFASWRALDRGDSGVRDHSAVTDLCWSSAVTDLYGEPSGRLTVDEVVLHYLAAPAAAAAQQQQQQQRQQQAAPAPAERDRRSPSLPAYYAVRVKRRFLYDFKLAGVYVMMLHINSLAPDGTVVFDADGREVLHLVEVYETTWGRGRWMGHPVAVGGLALLSAAAAMLLSR